MVGPESRHGNIDDRNDDGSCYSIVPTIHGSRQSGLYRARVAESRQQSQLPDSEQLGLVAQYWFSGETVCREWKRHLTEGQQRDSALEMRDQWDREAAVRNLDDVLALPHVHMDGTDRVPPNADDIDRFMRAFEAVTNDMARIDLLREAAGGENPGAAEVHIAPPAGLAELLRCTSGVYNVDFRHSSISSFPFLSVTDWNSTEEPLYSRMWYSADPERWGEVGMWYEDWKFDIAAGLLVDVAGYWPNSKDTRGFKWFSLLAYCHSKQEPDVVVGPFEWRIMLYCRTGDLDFDLYTFDSFPEFLA